MTLSDRLAAAAKARGEVVAVRKKPVEPPVAAPAAEEVAADRRRIVAAATQPAAAVEPELGAAPDSICPTCGRTGELGVIDLPGRTADWTCTACGTLWQVGLDEPATTVQA